MWFARRRFKPDGTPVRNERDVPLELLIDHLQAVFQFEGDQLSGIRL